MATQRKAKTKAGAPAPQSREEAASYVRRIGEANRAVARIEADMNDAIAALKDAAETAATPLGEEMRALTEGLRAWCEANRAALTDGGKRKSADLGTGKIEWRFAPPKATIKGVEAAIEAIKRLGLPFLRVKEEIDKEAMLADPARARLVPGVSVGSAGEYFAVEPFEAELAGGTP
ncbi:MAG: host-nuclease inhibitor Gam family protein [Roseiarcus sp.]|jgi:phage host-nuclease inhibitor protein Gam